MPLDSGFLRRECPNCMRQFKWHAGPTDDRPEDAADPPQYYCPYCGLPAGPDSWWTEEQVEYMEGVATGPAMRELEDELTDTARRASNRFFRISVESDATPSPPDPLTEPSDMTAVSSPCHPWEPIKIIEGWHDPIHCLVCGLQFAI